MDPEHRLGGGGSSQMPKKNSDLGYFWWKSSGNHIPHQHRRSTTVHVQLDVSVAHSGYDIGTTAITTNHSSWRQFFFVKTIHIVVVTSYAGYIMLKLTLEFFLPQKKNSWKIYLIRQAGEGGATTLA